MNFSDIMFWSVSFIYVDCHRGVDDMVINWDFSIVSYKFIGLNDEVFRNGKKFPVLSLILFSFDMESDYIC